jgi:hypothetical protein
MTKLNFRLSIFFLIIFTGITSIANADDVRQKSELATAEILFDYDNSFEYTSFKVDHRGWVDILFAQNIPDDLYEEILDRLLNHPDIPGVLAGKGGPMCSIF